MSGIREAQNMRTMHFTGTTLKAFGREIPATCVVRHEINGWRRPGQVVKTRGQTVPHGLAYYPRPFPPGAWEVTRVEDMGARSPFWPVFIDTNATQRLTVWDLDENGHYKSATNRQITGRGYAIHHARYRKGDELVPSNTTLGCINILDPTDASWLAEEICVAFGFKYSVWLHVPAWSEWTEPH